MSNLKKLPIGIQDFTKIRTGGYCYVDKTEFVARLANEGGGYYFLSRPRRFGKSLFVDTLKEAFEGNRDLFKGLYLEKNWDWSVQYPVILISFGSGVVRDRQTLDRKICAILDRNAAAAGIRLDSSLVNEGFAELIRKVHEQAGQPVVILVDEYDKPILDCIDKPEAALEIREGLKDLYSVIKDSGAHIRFAFLTGVSKFSKVSLFSGLNNLNDITLDARYGVICGYTEPELMSVFKEHLEGLDIVEVRKWYNGYNFLGTEKVYNPFDVLLLLDKREFRSYWFETATPTFLVKLLYEKQYNIPDLESVHASGELLGSFDVDAMQVETLLFQTGYLTIAEQKKVGAQLRYCLCYPNLEVRSSLNYAILRCLSGDAAGIDRNQERLFCALESGDMENLRGVFHAFFASIPHDWYRRNRLAGYEGYYCSVFYAYFTGLGLDVTPEDTTNRGRIDMTVKVSDHIYVMEFKVRDQDNTPQSALEQVRSRGYHEKYLACGKQVVLMGVEFSAGERNIVAFDMEVVKA